jgi:hypothetical protein
MIRNTLALAAATALLAPAAAMATDLGGSPTLRAVEGGRIQLKFAVDEKLPTKAGKVATRVTVNGKRVERLRRSGRHGNDFVYTALANTTGLEVGKKYTVRFRFSDGTVTRQVKVLRSARS